jgi:hypothetical protein
MFGAGLRSLPIRSLVGVSDALTWRKLAAMTLDVCALFCQGRAPRRASAFLICRQRLWSERAILTPNVAHLTPSLGGSVAKSGAFHLGGYPLNSAPKRRAGSIQWPKPKSQSASIWTQEAELVQERSLFWRRSAKPGPLRQPRDQ